MPEMDLEVESALDSLTSTDSPDARMADRIQKASADAAALPDEEPAEDSEDLEREVRKDVPSLRPAPPSGAAAVPIMGLAGPDREPSSLATRVILIGSASLAAVILVVLGLLLIQSAQF